MRESQLHLPLRIGGRFLPDDLPPRKRVEQVHGEIGGFDFRRRGRVVFRGFERRRHAGREPHVG